MEGYRSDCNEDHIQWRLVSKGTEGSQLQGGPGAFPRELGGGDGGSKTGPSPENFKNIWFQTSIFEPFCYLKRAKILGLHIKNLGFLILTSHNGCEEQLQIHHKFIVIQSIIFDKT